MPIVFPDGRRPAVRQDPAILLLYSAAKTGKTFRLAELQNNLIVDWEGGTDEHECMPVQVRSIQEFNEAVNEVYKRTVEFRKIPGNEKKYLYDYITIDTVDELEEAVTKFLTQQYNADVQRNPKGADGKTREKVQSIADLPYGAGYGAIREMVKDKIKQMGNYTKRLILTSHTKDKLLAGADVKTGTDVGDKEISLSGKLSTIIMSMCSAIGYVYRSDTLTEEVDGEKVPALMISFNTVSERPAAGARAKHLRGKEFLFRWSAIYIDENK